MRDRGDWIVLGGRVVLSGVCVVSALVRSGAFFVLYCFRVGDLWRFVGDLGESFYCCVSKLWGLWLLCLCGLLGFGHLLQSFVFWLSCIFLEARFLR